MCSRDSSRATTVVYSSENDYQVVVREQSALELPAPLTQN